MKLIASVENVEAVGNGLTGQTLKNEACPCSGHMVNLYTSDPC